MIVFTNPSTSIDTPAITPYRPATVPPTADGRSQSSPNSTESPIVYSG